MQVHLIDPDELHGDSVYLEGPEAKHIVKVLRRRPGDPITFTDGGGRYLHGVIDRATAGSVHARIERREDDPRETGAPWSTLAIALLKGDHLELAIEKVVEIGVHRIVPLTAQHCVVQWKEKGAGRKLERLQRIAESAMKQSGRSWRPEVTEPTDLGEALDRFGGAGATVIVADEQERARAVGDLGLEYGTPHLGLIGPEGAFSDDEKRLLQDRGAVAVTLGPYRLRSETAAIVLAAALHGGKDPWQTHS